MLQKATIISINQKLSLVEKGLSVMESEIQVIRSHTEWNGTLYWLISFGSIWVIVSETDFGFQLVHDVYKNLKNKALKDFGYLQKGEWK
jgi:hypothetical protein